MEPEGLDCVPIDTLPGKGMLQLSRRMRSWPITTPVVAIVMKDPIVFDPAGYGQAHTTTMKKDTPALLTIRH